MVANHEARERAERESFGALSADPNTWTSAMCGALFGLMVSAFGVDTKAQVPLTRFAGAHLHRVGLFDSFIDDVIGWTAVNVAWASGPDRGRVQDHRRQRGAVDAS